MEKLIVAILSIGVVTGPVFADMKAQQEALDAACQAARERYLEPMRAYYIEECVQRTRRYSGDVRARCERFYANFGNHTGHRAALFYDLPECVYAFEFRRGNQGRRR